MAFNKTISMRYDDFAGKCCRSLTENKYTSTDGDLVHFIGLQRLAEEISCTFDYDSASNDGRHLGLDTIELLVKAFASRLQDLRRSFPSNSTCLRKSCTF